MELLAATHRLSGSKIKFGGRNEVCFLLQRLSDDAFSSFDRKTFYFLPDQPDLALAPPAVHESLMFFPLPVQNE